MKERVICILTMLFFNCVLFTPSCITEQEVYDSAAREKELPKWRVLAQARKNYGPYIKWKESLIKELFAGSRIMYTIQNSGRWNIPSMETVARM